MTFDKVSAISFTAIQTDLQDCAYPCLKFHWAEDLVAPLPESEDSLLSALGKNTREIVKRYARKIKRKFPSFRFDVYVGSEIDEGLAQEIYRLHKARMSRKGKGSNVDAPRFEKILRLARLRGLMTVAKIDGEICGGLICWRAGHDYFMRIIAHDPAYDEYKLGTVCCYRTMCECIARGGRFFHFMSGRLLYKYRLLGIEQDFDTLILYRSRSALLKSIWKMSRTIATGANRQTRLWLQNAERKDDFMSRMAVLLVRQWRMLKQLRTALPGS
ncbi:MAG TPA: GNAT family N-acetyltransferase [Paucimonas sp.]|nr:GNAT family N-acetyltransferase [Paucimonas sp.]